ncbi:hypothetical protein P170DRAFT_449198 [Aspergillus steynii IBT 23096]|uniref:Tachykinin family protein n=1 Tax=Aspergillus steynii IBT 23096 TaxID=1392250 RepID=A0A2I2FY08_9EURO|nr:uncharacterized protein P170DRAFT_449198 [Aspergillus steynii IBT 23096]PLB45513.1 hypothetical protein P170DRAFT_449198 [Aspergillus steynii IBT 23096]
MDAKLPPRQQPAVSSAPQGEQVLPIHLAAHPPWPQDPPLPPQIPPVSYQNSVPVSGPVPVSVPATVPGITPVQPTLTNPPLSSPTAPYTNEQQTASTAVDSTRQDVGKTPAPKPRKSRKADNASGGRSTLFWVNSDQQSVSEGTREDTLKRIRSHVMSEHNRKKRLENTKRYKSKTWKHLAFQPVETAAAGPGPAAIGPMPPPPGRSSVKASSASRGKQASRQGHNNNDITNDMVVTSAPGHPAIIATGASGAQPYGYAVAPAPLSSPTMYLGHGAHRDPFNMAHTQLTDRMFRHLQRFLFDLTHIAYPLQRRYGPKLQAHWASLIRSDPASLHASICVAASNAALHTGEFPMVDPNKRGSSLLLLDTFHHRGETIRLVNEGLSDPIKASSDELIAAVSMLLTIEIASGNPDYLKVHLAGLRQMVGMRNKFTDVPPDVRYQISWTDIRVACMAFTKPIFPFVRDPRPAHMAPIIPPTKELECTASRLIALMKIPGIFGDVLSQVITDLLELVWYAEWIKGPVFQEFNEETENYFNTEVLYIEYALHADRYTARGEAKGDASIEGCVRLACFIYHNTAIWDFYPNIGPVFPKPIMGLRTALESIIPTGCFHLCRDLLTWLLFMGACASKMMILERTFFVTELATAVRIQGIRSWQDLRASLMNFFYVDRVYLTPLRELWDELRVMQAPDDQA